MYRIHALEIWIRHLATQVPLEVFVFVGSFLEEIIGPIPSTLVMTTAGALARFDGKTLLYVFWLAVIGNLGKTLATYVFYFLGDKLEDVTIKKFGRFLKLRHEDVENIGMRFGKSHWQDGGVLFLVRLMPFFPTTIVSIACGIIKMDLRVYLFATFFGNFGKDLIYVYSGYAGFQVIRRFFHQAEGARWWIGIGLILVALGLLYLYREHGSKLFSSLRNHLWKK